MTEQMYQNLTTEPDGYNRHHNFLRAALAVGLVCSIQGEEKQYSARWNRTRAAEEQILRLCDILLPDGMDKARLTSIMDVLDGPVEAVLERHWPADDGRCINGGGQAMTTDEIKELRKSPTCRCQIYDAIDTLLERVTKLEHALKNIASQPETGWMGAMECQAVAQEALKEVE